MLDIMEEVFWDGRDELLVDCLDPSPASVLMVAALPVGLLGDGPVLAESVAVEDRVDVASLAGGNELEGGGCHSRDDRYGERFS